MLRKVSIDNNMIYLIFIKISIFKIIRQWFDLKPFPDKLKYAYLDEKKIYPVIISANLSEHEEKKDY